MTGGVRYIPGKFYDVPEPQPMPDRVAIVAEIAERLLELRDLDQAFPGRLLGKFDQIWRTNPRAFWVCLEVLAGDNANVASLSEIASGLGTDKQNVQQTRRRDFDELAQKFPEAAKVLRQLFARIPNAGKT